jgi:hypothetical protein
MLQMRGYSGKRRTSQRDQANTRKLIMRKPGLGWTPEEESRLYELAAKGSTLLRACAALGRPASSVRKKAIALGLHFAGPREVKAKNRAIQKAGNSSQK